MKKILLFFFSLMYLQQLYSEDPLLSRALDFEKLGNYKDAIICYKDYLKKSTDEKTNEKLYLRIARLTQNFNEAVSAYNTYLTKYPKSRFRFFGRFELAKLYLINGDYDNSKVEFYKIAEFSKGTPYWQTSLIEATKIEIHQSNFKRAIKNLYDILNEIDDYEDIGVAYYLLGIASLRQKSYLDSEEFFLISAGSFPESEKAATSLLELFKLYLDTKKEGKALLIAKMINELYTDSPENDEAYNILQKLKVDNTKSNETVELINLNENPEIKKRTLRRLREDLKLSLEYTKNTTTNNPNEKKIFVQVGFFSQEENATTRLKDCRDKNINDVFIKKTKSSKSNDYFYRVLTGPFNSKERANQKLIELKEKNIESIILEINDE